jgi:hypothetical protein
MKRKNHSGALFDFLKSLPFYLVSHIIQVLDLFDEFWLFLNCCWIILN